jgi:hypothetical protein
LKWDARIDLLPFTHIVLAFRPPNTNDASRKSIKNPSIHVASLAVVKKPAFSIASFQYEGNKSSLRQSALSHSTGHIKSDVIASTPLGLIAPNFK